MLKRRPYPPPEHLYPADEWRVVESRCPEEVHSTTHGRSGTPSGPYGLAQTDGAARALLSVLDLRRRTLVREVRWETAAGKRVTIRSTRLVSL